MLFFLTFLKFAHSVSPSIDLVLLHRMTDLLLTLTKSLERRFSNGILVFDRQTFLFKQLEFIEIGP